MSASIIALILKWFCNHLTSISIIFEMYDKAKEEVFFVSFFEAIDNLLQNKFICGKIHNI